MKKITRILLLCLFLSLSVSTVFAQTDDARFRAGIRVDKKLSSNIELNVETQVRLKNNGATFDKVLLEPAIKYNFSKRWQTGLIYRYAQQQNTSQQILGKQRLSTFLRYKYPIGPDWDLKAKSTLQYGTRNWWGGYAPDDNEWVNRNKISVSYDMFGKPYAIEAGTELFYGLEKERSFEQVRWFGELSYQFSKKSTFSLQYIHSKNRVEVPNAVRHIFMMLYRIKI